MTEKIISSSLEYTTIILLNSNYQMVVSISYLSPQIGGTHRGVSYCIGQGFMQKPIPANVQRIHDGGLLSRQWDSNSTCSKARITFSEQDTERRQETKVEETYSKKIFYLDMAQLLYP